MSITASQLFAQIKLRYQNFTLRERVLIGFSVAVILWLVWAAMMQAPIARTKSAHHHLLQTVETNLQAEQARNNVLQKRINKDPDSELRVEKAQLEQEIQRIKGPMTLALARFVEPERIPALLQDVLNTIPSVKIVRVARLPVEPISLQPDADIAAGPKPDTKTGPLVFRHPIQLELEGSYFELTAYIRHLEASQWKFNWRQLDYSVMEYPKAKLVLVVETLSRQRNWIGV